MKAEPVLAILIPGFPADEQDSVCLPAQQSFVLAMNRFFPEQKIVILSFQYPFEKKEYNWHGNEVISFGGKNRGGLSRILLWSRIEKRFLQLMKEKNVSGILSFWCGECALVGKRLSKQYHLPFFIWLMGQDAKKQNRYVRRIRPKPAELIAISDFTRQEFAKNHLVQPEQVIPIGVNDFRIKKRERNIDIFGAGSLIPLKQFDLFIDMIRRVKENTRGIKACIAGKGPEEGRLKELIRKNGLGDNISLPGELPHQELLDLMSRSKIFLHPSSYEGFSGVCLEALHAGASVVSFCKPMKHEIQNWYTVSTADEMETKLRELLQSANENAPVNAYPVELAARAVMKLFNFQPRRVS